MSMERGPFDRLIDAMGKKPPQLAGYVGQEVTVRPEGLEPFNATLEDGPYCYVARGPGITLQLYVGHPVEVVTGDGTAVDFRNVQM